MPDSSDRVLDQAGSALAAAMVLSLALSGCGLRQPQKDQAPEISVELTSFPDPPRVGDGRLTLVLMDPSGSAVEHAQIQVRGDMTHPGMSPILSTPAEGIPGMYPMEFAWTMAGDWILTVQGFLPDGRRLLRTIPIRVEPVPAAP